jgi:hypothetical protein
MNIFSFISISSREFAVEAVVGEAATEDAAVEDAATGDTAVQEAATAGGISTARVPARFCGVLSRGPLPQPLNVRTATAKAAMARAAATAENARFLWFIYFSPIKSGGIAADVKSDINPWGLMITP